MYKKRNLKNIFKTYSINLQSSLVPSHPAYVPGGQTMTSIDTDFTRPSGLLNL